MPLQEEEDFGSQQGQGRQTTCAVSPSLPLLFEVPIEYISTISTASWVPSDMTTHSPPLFIPSANCTMSRNHHFSLSNV